jgi:NADH dehydrogenase
LTVAKKRIVIVGGGAGGLELATTLGRKLGRKGKAEITLVDRNPSHLWKPLLHEIATGSLDEGVDALSYLAHAKAHGFYFQMGSLIHLDRANKKIALDKITNSEGETLVAMRSLDYDMLVFAVGSVSNDFNTPGIKEHCIFLDKANQAKRFHNEMLDLFLKFSSNVDNKDKVNIAIVGGGATGVELSAELHHTVQELHRYGYDKLSSDILNITLVEAGERILPALPEKISIEVTKVLQNLGVNVLTKTMVTSADASGLNTKDGGHIAADLMVWAAGIKAPDVLHHIGGLETNKINQLVVKPTLQTTDDDSIFALGDCASCAMPKGGFVAPRAQAAHQMANLCAKNIIAAINGKPLKAFVFMDKGSLVSLSKFTAVGSLLGNVTKDSIMIEGKLARLMYISLYRLHQLALHGYIKTGLLVLVDSINRVLRPRLKLH